MNKKTLIALTIFFSCIAIVTCNYREKFRHETSESHNLAYEGLQFLSAAAAFPNAEIPPDGYGKALEFMQTNFANQNMRSHVNGWRSLGPQNVGGRTISIALDPVDTNIIWLGSASGGLWKSVTGGYGANAWQYIPTGFPVLGVGGIAINPLNKNEMFIGTGETYDYGTSVNGLVIRPTRGSNGIGILKSTDGGISWTQSLNWNYNQTRGVWNVIYNPANPQTVYAGTTEGVYKSTDGGNTWSQSLNYTMVMDLVIDPNDTTILYAGVGNLSSNAHGLYKTDDAGATWSKLTNGLPSISNTGRISIDVFKNNSNIVMVHIADNFSTVGVYRTFNKGATWAQVTNYNIAGIQGWYAKCLKMNDNNNSHVFAGGVNLYESIDAGVNFTVNASYTPGFINTVPWSDVHGMISNPFDADKIYLLTDAGLYRSSDFGAHWRWCADGYNVSQFYHGSVAANDSGLALGGLQDRNTHRFDGSLTWLPVNGGDGTFNAIDQTDASIQYCASQYLYLNKSTDYGYSFSPIFGGNYPAFVAPFVIAPSNHLRLYAGDESINVTVDGGVSWTSSGPVDNYNPILSMDVSYINENKVYFATAPSDNFPMHVFLSDDGGFTYYTISTGLPNRYPRDIAVDPSNDEIAYVVFSGFGSGHVFRTDNSGISWTDISTSLPDVPFHSVMVNPKNTNMVFAGSDFGVFVTFDAGLTWQTLNDGLPEGVMVFDLEYSPSDKSVVAFTHGHGAYKINIKDIDVGITEAVSARNYFGVYPTLTQQDFSVEYYSEKISEKKLEIIDATGKIILTQKIKSGLRKDKILVSFPSGTRSGYYWCRLTGDDFSFDEENFQILEQVYLIAANAAIRRGS